MEDPHPDSNCVVHDDTFDWGGITDIIPTDESDNNSSNGDTPYFPNDRSSFRKG